MKSKTSLEVREIFDLSIDDIKRLEKAGVINPLKRGQGRASQFAMSDLDRLLDVKIHLLAGYRISDMSEIFTEKYDAEESIRQQIHIHEKRILMLEFIKTIRDDLKKLENLNKNQLTEIGQASVQYSKIPFHDIDEYFDTSWKFIKLVFIMDYLSQKHIFDDESDVVRKAYDAYSIIKEIIRIIGIEIDESEVHELFIDMADSTVEDDQAIRLLVKEWVSEYRKVKDELLEEIDKKNITPAVNNIDVNAGECFRSVIKHLFQFTMDYFVNEDELFWLYHNFRKFIYRLDRDALSKGIVKIGGK